jgi:iron complex outermembrane receptor protein
MLTDRSDIGVRATASAGLPPPWLIGALLLTTALCPVAALAADAAARQEPAITAQAATTVQAAQAATTAQAAQAATSTQVAQAATARTYDIPAQPLIPALVKFSEVSGLQLFFDSNIARAYQSPGITGTMTPEQALGQLLAGTPLTYRFSNPTTVTLERVEGADSSGGAVVLPPVAIEGTLNRESAWGHVEGYVAERSASGTKTDTPIVEIPQSISVITADQIQAQGVQNLGQALRYTPGVLSETFGAVSQFDVYTQVRGFRPSLYQDGMRLPYGVDSTGFASAIVDPYGLERIEVLKGPSSGLYGQNSPGGLINMVSKRPTETPLHEVQIETGSFARRQAAADFGGSLTENGRLSYRLTGLFRESDTQVDFIENNRAYIAPALTAKLDEDTSLTLLGSYQNEWGGKTLFNYLPVSGTLTDNVNGRIPMDRYAGDPFFDHLEREQYSAGYLFEHRVNDAVTLRQNFRYSHVEFDAKALTLSGTMSPTSDTVNRSATRTEAQSDAFAIDNQAQVDFATGGLDHVALFGVDFRRELNDFKFGRGAAPAINIYNPVYGVPITAPGYNIQQLEGTQNQIGAYVQDQIKLDQWALTLSGRYDRADSTTYNRNNNTTVDQDDRAFTGRVGLSYLFNNGITPYISYATSFQPTPGASFDGTPFKPTTGTQYEAGVKYQPPGSNSLYTASVFDITQQEVTTSDPAHANFQLQVGEVRVRGFELEAKTQITPSFAVTGAYAFLDHEITESSNPADLGHWLQNTPRHQASIWGDYRLQHGQMAWLGFGLGVRWVGETRDATNTLEMPDYAVVDAAIYYDLGHLRPDLEGAKLAVNVSNLFNEYYIPACNTTTGCTLGAGRTVLATITYDW